MMDMEATAEKNLPVTNKRLKLHHHVVRTSDENGLEYLEIDNPLGSGKIALQGAHVIDWQPKFETQPVLWLSSNARFVKARSIRGGVPICWPWFGAHPTDSTFCMHGFARVIPWRVVDVDATPTGATRVVLEMLDTPEAKRQLSYPYTLTLTVTIGESLRLELATTNLGNQPFMIGEGYHTYFEVSDIENIRVTGLEDCVFADKIVNYERGIQHGALKFNHEFDKVYLNTSGDCVIEDKGYNRAIRVAKSGSNTSVVWTPWADKAHQMGDMGNGDEWRKMICVESVNAMENSVMISPNQTHVLMAEYSLEE